MLSLLAAALGTGTKNVLSPFVQHACKIRRPSALQCIVRTRNKGIVKEQAVVEGVNNLVNDLKFEF